MTWRQGRNPDKNPARKCVVLGKSCDSKMEGERWLELSMMERAGEIRNLVHHPRFALVVGEDPATATLVCTYEGDSEYDLAGTGLHVVEDVKGRRSGPAWSLFRIKSKLFEALHGYDITVYPPAPPRKPRRKRA